MESVGNNSSINIKLDSNIATTMANIELDIKCITLNSVMAEEHAVNIIKKAFKKYSQKKEDAIITQYGFKKLTNRKIGHDYYYDQEGNFIVRSLSADAKIPKRKLKGKYKAIAAIDNNYIKLEIIKNNKKLDKRQYNVIINEYLRGYTSLCKGIYVNKKTMIAKYGGDNLDTFIKKGQVIKLISFKNLLSELKKLHRINIYLSDIKPKNMVYDGKVVRHIDLDNIITKEFHDFTIQYCTKELYQLKKQERGKPNQNHDNYALLLSIIQAMLGKHLSCIKKNDTCRQWISNNVLKDYQDYAGRLLSEPHKIERPIAIFDIIDWNLVE